MQKLIANKKKFFGIAAIITFFLLLVIFQVPDMIVEKFGEDHAYLALFLIAAFGGVSVFTSASYFGTVIAFASAGLNPWLLGLAGGAGVTIGDSLFFLFGNHSRVIVSKNVDKVMDHVRSKLERFNKWSVPIFVYLYAAFSPLPNEFMTISVGLSGAKYRIVGPPLLLGNITITIITAFIIYYAGI